MEENIIQAIRNAILEFAVEHSCRPFGVLREAGVQAAIKRLADQHLGQHSSLSATIIDVPGNGGVPVMVETDRVRLEAKIVRPGKPAGERTDLIAYRSEGVRLFRHPSGPGDVVYLSESKNVLAAVEIKASPSSQLGERRKYASDVCKLLKLTEDGITAFFVLLDKSSEFYMLRQGREPFKCINWEPNPGLAASLATVLFGINSQVIDSDIAEVMVTSVHPKQHCVEIWNVSTNKEAERLFYAYRPSANCSNQGYEESTGFMTPVFA